MISYLRALFVLIFALYACRREGPTTEPKQKWNNASSVDFNQELSIRENIKIETFLAHYTDLKMTQSASGLRYFIYHQDQPNSQRAKEGQQAIVKLKIGLLDGTTCYQTPELEVERIVIAHSEKESGIHEALMLLGRGDKAKLILPSYLGHGLLGDRMKIPPQSILYIDIQLIDLQ